MRTGTLSMYQGKVSTTHHGTAPTPPSPYGGGAGGRPPLTHMGTLASSSLPSLPASPQRAQGEASIANEASAAGGAVGGSLGLIRARDTGNSPTRSRLATPLSSSFRELPVSPPVSTPQFSATNPFTGPLGMPRSAGGIGHGKVCSGGVAGRGSSRSGSGGVVAMSLDSSLRNGGIGHHIQHSNVLIPPLYVPPVDETTPASPTSSTGGAMTPTKALPSSPVSPQSSSKAPAHRAAVTVVFDLDETLCNNRRPGKALLRPHALELLHHLNQLRNDPSVNCYVELILWTASMECVARPVVERMDPTGTLFQHLIYRDRRWYKETGYTKDLKRLGREMHHTVIIENSPASVHLNRKHSILVRDFVTGADNELLVVKDVLDGWIRQAGQCAKALGAPPPNEVNSPSSIVKYTSEHPAINAGNEVISTPPSRQQHQSLPLSKPGSSASSSYRSSSMGLSVSRFAINRPSAFASRRF